ncbi:MAG: hypothetical protein EAX86_09485 [Candidatus Heimdallarchaeota archaeon]|nr:hypothetical protein [Candidatus Heimdallarchaeota archaeon]
MLNQERCNSCGGSTIKSVNTLDLKKYILFWGETWSKAHPLTAICSFLLIGSFLGITSLINILIPLLLIGFYSVLSYKKRELMTTEERYSEFFELKLTRGLFLVALSIALACYFSDMFFFSYSNIVTKIIIIIAVTIVTNYFLIHRFILFPDWIIFDHITAYKKCQIQISTLDYTLETLGLISLPLFAILTVLIAFSDISSILEHFYYFIALILVIIPFSLGIIYLFMLKSYLRKADRLLFTNK